MTEADKLSQTIFGSQATIVTKKQDETTYPALSSANSNGTMGFTYYARNCYDTLVTREGEEIVPALAETWEISDDGLTYTFHLKEGVKFSDGADLNAEAVKTSIEAAFSNMGDAIAQFGKIGVLTESVEAVDEYTVVLHLTSPYYGVLSDLAMCNPMAIVPSTGCCVPCCTGWWCRLSILFSISTLPERRIAHAGRTGTKICGDQH